MQTRIDVRHEKKKCYTFLHLRMPNFKVPWTRYICRLDSGFRISYTSVMTVAEFYTSIKKVIVNFFLLWLVNFNICFLQDERDFLASCKLFWLRAVFSFSEPILKAKNQLNHPEIWIRRTAFINGILKYHSFLTKFI